jgi:hypothetical protein
MGDTGVEGRTILKGALEGILWIGLPKDWDE